VHGNLTASGKPLLSNDPHLQLLAPSLWQLTVLSCPSAGINVVGASFAGLPGVVIGRTARAAWGVTNTGVDIQDLYVLRELNSTHYLVDGAPVAYTLRSEVIKVSGAADVILPVRVSRFGPVMTDNGVIDALGGPPLALRWATIDPSITDTSFEAFYGLQRVADWASFRAALRSWSALASQNVIYADVDGNIGYQMPGVAVVRAANHSGAFPMPGDTAAYDWRGFVPFDALPRAFNPPSGFVVSANNRVQPAGAAASALLTSDWDEGSDGFRARRITQLISAGAPRHSAATMAAIQGDVVSGAARDFAAALRANVSDALFAAGGGGRALRDLLAAWDGSTAVGSREATLWADLYAELARLPAAETGLAFWSDPVFLLNAIERGDPACALAGFPSCGAFAAAALDRVAVRNGLGPGASSASLGAASVPAWGVDVHVLQADHAILSASPLACVADRDVAHGGDEYTVNVGTFGFSRDEGDASQYAQTHGPSYRHVVDLAAPDAASLFVHPMGADGAPFAYEAATEAGADEFRPAGTYDDLMALWAAGSYVPMDARASAVPADAHVMRLAPA
jgi:penicillin amidase